MIELTTNISLQCDEQSSFLLGLLLLLWMKMFFNHIEKQNNIKKRKYKYIMRISLYYTELRFIINNSTVRCRNDENRIKNAWIILFYEEI